LFSYTKKGTGYFFWKKEKSLLWPVKGLKSAASQKSYPEAEKVACPHFNMSLF